MIETLRTIRRQTCQALADAVTDLADAKPSESELRDAFDQRLSTLPELSAQGWYLPPPKGIILVIGNPPNYARLEQASFRPEPSWPSDAERLDTESIVYAYSSRVHIPTGAIGDTGCSLYRGTNSAITTHLHRVWDVTMQIATEAEAGMRFNELYAKAAALIEASGFENNIYSVHDGSSTNIGHTIPWSDRAISSDEQTIVQTGRPTEVADLVSNQRRYVSATEALEITGDMAFTIEPRLNAPGLPMVSFHIVVGFENNQKAVITEFEPIFERFGMSGFDAA